MLVHRGGRSRITFHRRRWLHVCVIPEITHRDRFTSVCESKILSLNPNHLEQPHKGMCSAAVLSNPCASFNPKLCQDLGETEHPLTAGAPPKTYFSCPVEAPVYGRPPPHPTFPLSPANKDSFIICRLISCRPSRRLPGNGGAGSCPCTSPRLWSREACVVRPTKGSLRGLGLWCPPPASTEAGGIRVDQK